MAENHLQLHGHIRSNDEEPRRSSSSSRGCGNCLQFQQAVAEKNHQGKNICGQLIQQAQLHSQLIASLLWVGNKLFFFFR